MFIRSAIVVFGVVTFAACGGDAGSQGLGVTAGGPAADTAAERCPPGTDEFRYGPSGLLKSDPATGVSVRLLDASDSPPSRGFNDWTIGVFDQSGAPMPTAELHWACAWMPAHLHGSNPKTVVRLGNGQFQLVKQNLAMYGGWQVKLWVDASGTGPAFDPQGNNGILGGDACRGPGIAGAPNIEFDICVPTSAE